MFVRLLGEKWLALGSLSCKTSTRPSLPRNTKFAYCMQYGRFIWMKQACNSAMPIDCTVLNRVRWKFQKITRPFSKLLLKFTNQSSYVGLPIPHFTNIYFIFPDIVCSLVNSYLRHHSHLLLKHTVPKNSTCWALTWPHSSITHTWICAWCHCKTFVLIHKSGHRVPVFTLVFC